MTDKETDIIVDGEDNIIKIDDLELAKFKKIEDAQQRKIEIDKAIKHDNVKKIPPSVLHHCTGWKYVGQVSLPPELFISDDETEKDFLVKITALEDKLSVVGIDND